MTRTIRNQVLQTVLFRRVRNHSSIPQSFFSHPIQCYLPTQLGSKEDWAGSCWGVASPASFQAQVQHFWGQTFWGIRQIESRTHAKSNVPYTRITGLRVLYPYLFLKLQSCRMQSQKKTYAVVSPNLTSFSQGDLLRRTSKALGKQFPRSLELSLTRGRADRWIPEVCCTS